MNPETPPQKNPSAFSVPFPEMEKAFSLFLGRKPNQSSPPVFDNIRQMYQALANSAEFKASPRSFKTALGWPHSQLFVSQPAKVLYCPIGKNACSFFKSQMLRISDIPFANYIIQRDTHFLTDRVRTGAQLSDYSPEKATAIMNSSDYFKFAIIRDPAERLLSAYIEKFVLGRLAPANIQHTRTVIDPVQKRNGTARPDYDRGISFRDFVEQITSVDAETLDPHWRPQSLYLKGIQYDRIYDFGAINEVVDLLEERSGIPLPRRPLNVTGSGNNTGTVHPGAADLFPAEIEALPRLDKSSFVDAELEELITDYFCEDIRLLETPKSPVS